MIEVRNLSAPLLELVVSHEDKQTLVKVFGVLALDDHLLDSIDGLVSRYGLAEGVRDWVYLHSLQLLSMAEVQSKKLVGNDDGLVSRQDLLKFCDIKGPALNNRINKMGHPKPIKVGRKQWFDVDRVDAWITKQKTK